MKNPFSLGKNSTRINPNNFPQFAIGQGKVIDTSVARLQAVKNTFTVDAEQFIWDQASVPAWPSDSGEALSVKSISSLDVGVNITVTGLDENFEPTKAVAVLNGTSSVALPGLWSRVNSATIVGSTPCVGLVTVTNGTTVFSAVQPAYQQDLKAQYSVPAGYVAQVHMILAKMTKISTGTSKGNIELKVYYRTNKNEVFKMEFVLGLNTEATSTFEFTEPFPISLTGPVDYYVTATSTQATIAVGVRMQILMEKQ